MNSSVKTVMYNTSLCPRYNNVPTERHVFVGKWTRKLRARGWSPPLARFSFFSSFFSFFFFFFFGWMKNFSPILSRWNITELVHGDDGRSANRWRESRKTARHRPISMLILKRFIRPPIDRARAQPFNCIDLRSFVDLLPPINWIRSATDSRS